MLHYGYWLGAGGAALVAALSGVAEWRRSRRKNLDKVGLISWNAVQLIAWFALFILAALAVKN